MAFLRAETGSSAPLRGVLSMIAGGALLTANDAVLKWLTAGYPVGQIMFLRGVFALAVIAVLVRFQGGRESLAVRRPGVHLLRGGLVIAGTAMYVTGLRYLPLADMIAITFAGPLFVTALAPALLGEHVGWRRWTAVLVGFVGVLIIIRPTGHAVHWAALLPLGASLTGAFRDLLTRGATATESSVGLLATTTAAVALAGLATAPFGWARPMPADIGLLAVSGLLLACAHFLMIESFRFGEAALVTPFKYANIVVAAFLGYVVWGDLPDAWAWFGTAVVVVSGLYILHRETRYGRS